MATLEDFPLQTALAAVAGVAERLGLDTLAIDPGAAMVPIAVAAAAVATAAMLFAVNRRLVRRASALERRLDEVSGRLSGIELLLSDLTSDASSLRERVEQVAVRQDTSTSAGSRASLRQAIALSRHGATLRQLVDTCSLSQGEAHLIRTLYGRAEDGQTGEVH